MSIFKTPKFWNTPDSYYTKLLHPVAKIYELISKIKLNSVTPEKAKIPVVCVGNVVIGGAGKTPTVKLVCNILKSQNFTPHILTSGYGGYLKNVVRVDCNKHSYLQVGDEALLSALVSPTWVGKNRLNSANAATLSGADILVMDDGFQNNSIEKNFKILVVDSHQGFGNEHIFPAGPLRENVESGVKKSDIVLIIGQKNENIETKIKGIRPNIPIFYATMDVSNTSDFIAGEKVIGFCGLGFPQKFKKTLEKMELEVIDFIAFSDHHPYTITEIQKLLKAARNLGAKLVTTRKDYIKIPDVFKNDISVIDINLSFTDESFQGIMLKSIDEFFANSK